MIRALCSVAVVTLLPTLASDSRASLFSDAQNWISQPTWYDGNDLHSLCSGKGKSLCFGFVGGTVETSMLMARKLDSAPEFCPPKEAQVQQFIDISAAYLKDRPEKRHLSASFLILASLQEAYPCSN